MLCISKFCNYTKFHYHQVEGEKVIDNQNCQIFTGWPPSWKSGESLGKSGKVKRDKIIWEFEEKKRKVKTKSGIEKGCPNIKLCPFLNFTLIISVSTKIPYQEVKEISLRPGKVREDKSKK